MFSITPILQYSITPSFLILGLQTPKQRGVIFHRMRIEPLSVTHSRFVRKAYSLSDRARF
jgi:hypothetical protein